MRANPLNKTVNEIKSAYTYYLEQKRPQIYGMMVRKDVSLDVMKKNIANYIFNASYKTADGTPTKKKWFLETMNKMISKKDIYWFCINSINKAKTTIAR